MAKSRGQMIAEREKRGQKVIDVEDAVTKESLIKTIRAKGGSANKGDSLAVLKKKLAATEGE